MFFGDKEVEKTEEKDGKTVVSFKDGTSETMTLTEWEAGKSEKSMDAPAELQEALIRRSVPVALAIQKTLMDFNPRYLETKIFMQRVLDGVTYAFNEAKGRVFGVKSFQGDVNIDMILKKIEEKGQDPFEDLNDREKSFINLVRQSDIKIWEIESGSAFIGVTEKIMRLIDKAIDLTMGSPGNSMRTDDIEKILKENAPVVSKPEEAKPAV